MNKEKIRKILLIVIPLIFYIGITVFDGYYLGDDSGTYIVMDYTREPLYPCFLALLRFIFGSSIYLNVAAIVQGVLMVLAINILINYLNREFELKDYLSYVFLAIFLGISFLNRFVAGRGSTYAESILSESLAYPLFIIFIRYLIDYLLNNDNKKLIFSAILSFLMISTRKQMYVSLALIIVVVIFNEAKKKKILALIGKSLFIALLVFGLVKIYDLAYITSLYGEKTTHTNDNRFLSTMVFYNSDSEFEKYIDDEETKEIFSEIYSVIDKKHYTKKYAGNSWTKHVYHFGDNYDHIQINTMNPIMSERAKELTNSPIEMSLKIDEFNNEIISSLLPHMWHEILLTFCESFLYGLVITVSAERTFFWMYALIIYGVYMFLTYKSIKTFGINDKYSLLSLFTLISILGNVALVSLVIFNQTRYTIYNMGLFYISLTMLIYNLYIRKHEN